MESNRFQPSTQQCNELVKYNQIYNINNTDMTNLNWLNEYDLEPFLFDGIEPLKINDQKNRAKLVVDMVLNSGKKTIALFDGHGRMYYLILMELFNRNVADINDYNFKFYELDEPTHRWHQEFFPLKNCQCVFGNIFECPNIYDNDTFIYFNFCGLGGSGADLFVFAKNYHDEFILSLSKRGQPKSPNQLNASQSAIHKLKRINMYRKQVGLAQSRQKFNMECGLKDFQTFAMRNELISML
jgi:hypothetical protein